MDDVTENQIVEEADVEVDLDALADRDDDAVVDAEAAAIIEEPKKRGRRRAASRPAGPPAALFSAAGESHAPVAEAEAPPAHAVAAVFIAPEVVPVDDQPKKTDVTDSPAEDAEEGTGEDGEPTEGGPARTRKRRRRGGRGRGRRADGDQAEGEESNGDADAPEPNADDETSSESEDDDEGGGSSRRRRRRRRGGKGGEGAGGDAGDEVTSLKGSTRLEAKKQRRREGRANRGGRAPILTEAEFLARREAVDRRMVVRRTTGITQIAVLEDDVLVEHYVGSESNTSMIGNVYLGRVQNVLPSMEAAFIDIGRGRNAVLYAGEVNWDAAGLEGQPKRIELALKSGDSVLVQVTKDPIGHKGARLTSQVSLPGRFLVYVPEGGMTGISRKLPDRERARLKKILREIVPDEAGVIVRTAAEGATEEQLAGDVDRLAAEWEKIKTKSSGGGAPLLLRSEPDLAIKVARDIFNEDFKGMLVSGEGAYEDLHTYIGAVAPDIAERVQPWTEAEDVFHAKRIDEQLTKALDRKVWLPSGGSLVIDRTEAMTVIDVNTGKFTGQGGNLEETVTRNNLEAAEEIVRQLRLRDIGGIIVVDFIDMVLENNRDLVVRRLVECLSRDRTKHQVAGVTTLGLVQMTRKRIGQGLLETFAVTCEACAGRGVKIHLDPVGHTPVESKGRARRPKVTGPIPGAPMPPKVEESAVSEAPAEVHEPAEAEDEPAEEPQSDGAVD